MKLAAQYLLLFFIALGEARAESGPSDAIRIGVIASLSGFAASYGHAVLEGAELAKDELKRAGITLELRIEDDSSQMRSTVSGYHRLRREKNLSAIVGGSWWLESVVPLAAQDGLPLLSCETVFHDATVEGETYFILSGYLAPWIQVFRPILATNNLRTAAVIRSRSGFGRTLGRAMKDLFTLDGRRFLGEIEYHDLDAEDARSLVLQLAQLKPDAVYIDAHPGGLANILRRMSELQLSGMTVLSNAIARDMHIQGLFDAKGFQNLYFSDRQGADEEFRHSFTTLHGHEPRLNADLGYLSVLLAAEMARMPRPLAELRTKGIMVKGRLIKFDEKNVWPGPQQELWQLLDGPVSLRK